MISGAFIVYQLNDLTSVIAKVFEAFVNEEVRFSKNYWASNIDI